jgi:hypothetical protein
MSAYSDQRGCRDGGMTFNTIALTATNVAGKKMDDMKAMTFMDRVSLVDWDASILTSLFSSALRFDNSCIAAFMLCAVWAVRMSNTCSIWEHLRLAVSFSYISVGVALP